MATFTSESGVVRLFKVNTSFNSGPGFYLHILVVSANGSLVPGFPPRRANRARPLLSAYHRLPNRNTGVPLDGIFIAEAMFD
jgi:hypothetical protein